MFKYTLVFAALLFLLCACKPSTDERARDLIMHYCDVSFKHYQPINFGPAHEYYVPYQRSAKAVSYATQLAVLKHKKDSLNNLIAIQSQPGLLLQAEKVNQAMLALDTLQAQYKNSYKPERKGWKVVHQYSHKNIGRPLVKSSTVFIIDADFKNVLETYQQ